MNELLTKLQKLKPTAKLGITVGAMFLVAALYNFMFYLDLSDEISSQEQRETQLRTERESYEKRKREYLAYRNELTQLQEEQRELLKALPKRAEIASFLSNIQEQAELSGVETVNLTSDQEIPDELYVKIPIRMEIRGSFHGITKFFKNISELRRIVNIENWALIVDRGPNEAESGPPKLRAKFIANTFRYQDQAGGGS